MLRAGKQPGFGGSGIESVFQKSRHKPGQDREQRHRIPRVEGLSAQKPREQPACAEQKDDRREDVYPAAALFPHGPADAFGHCRKRIKIVVCFKPEVHTRSFSKKSPRVQRLRAKKFSVVPPAFPEDRALKAL